MNQYTFFAKVYDKMMDNIPYEEWEEYLLQLMYIHGVRPGASIAEMGCGTGNMTMLLAEDGFRMTGIDLSKEMLEIAEAKRLNDAEISGDYPDSEESRIEYIYADMRNFLLPEKKDLIISICDSMNYLLTEEDLYLAMKSARENVKDGGIFIFDLKTRWFYENELDGRTFRGRTDGISYVWRNAYDRESDIHEYRLEFKYRGDNKRREKTGEVHRQRAYTAAEIIEAARRAGFIRGSAYDAFTFDRPRKNSERIYIVLKTDKSVK